MNFRSLHYFNEVAKIGSIRKAAEELYISEQSLSEYIKRLEKEMGIVLVNRTRPQTLTSAGQIFYSRSQEILQVKKKLEYEMRQERQRGEATKVIVSVGPMGIPVFLPEMMAVFNERYPQYRVEVREKNLEESKLFAENELCFLLGMYYKELHYEVLKTDYCCVLVSEDQLKETYQDSWKAVCQEMEQTGDLLVFKELTYIDEKQEQADPFVESWKILVKNGFRPKTICFSGSIETNLSFCIQGMGALLSTEDMILRLLHARNDEKSSHMYHFRLVNPWAEANLTLAYRKNKKLTEAEEAFIQVAKEHMAVL